MSNDDGMRVWVGDLDDHVDTGEIDRRNEREAREAALRDDLDAVGDLPLLDGRGTSAKALDARGIEPDEWRWAVHEAERSIPGPAGPFDLEGGLVRGLLALGRPYAVGRYARWEGLTIIAARTAVLPFGHLALVDQHLSLLDPAGAREARLAVRAAIRTAEATEGLVAYERTAMIRTAILRTMNVARAGEVGRESMRVLLSLTRLRFSATEADVRSFAELRALDDRYAAARRRTAALEPVAPAGSRTIRNWSLRHIHPLTFLMPIAIRAALNRGMSQLAPRPKPTADAASPEEGRLERRQAVNELALARCATILMRRTARQR